MSPLRRKGRRAGESAIRATGGIPIRLRTRARLCGHATASAGASRWVRWAPTFYCDPVISRCGSIAVAPREVAAILADEEFPATVQNYDFVTSNGERCIGQDRRTAKVIRQNLDACQQAIKVS